MNKFNQERIAVLCREIKQRYGLELSEVQATEAIEDLQAAKVGDRIVYDRSGEHEITLVWSGGVVFAVVDPVYVEIR